MLFSFHFFDLTYFDVRLNDFWILLAGIRNIIKEKRNFKNLKIKENPYLENYHQLV